MPIKSFRPHINRIESGPITRALKLIPLGGVGDVTKNMYVYEYGNDIIIVDCGIGFPDEGMLGIDLVIPDISYLKDKLQRIRGIVISHGHEDHIGSLPYLWPELNCPIYAQKLASGFIRAKFAEARLPDSAIKTVGLSDKLNLGAFQIEFYRVSHSIPDSTGLVITTPVGVIIHQSDFKLDWTPVNGEVTDVGRVATVGNAGVMLMLIDGLRVERHGYTLSEKSIQQTFTEIEAKTRHKLLITTNSSNITRIQQVINVAALSGRKVAMVGRSMEQNFQVARDLGYLSVPPGVVIDSKELKRFADELLIVLIAGSQGQPGSSLSRAANNSHDLIKIKPGDAVVFSADPIPASETAYYALIDKLSKMGIDTYYSDITSDLHRSGHAAAEEIKLMIKLARPRYVMPIGTTFRGMRAFLKMSEDLGYQSDQVLVLENGRSLNITKGGVSLGERIEVKNIFVDGLGVGDVGNVVLRDRQLMAEEGIVMVVVPLQHQTGKVVGEVEIISRGFVFEEVSESLLNQAKEVVHSSLKDQQNQILDWRFARRNIEEYLEKFFYEETKRRPLILPIVVEV